MIFNGQYSEFSQIRKSVAQQRLKEYFSCILTEIKKVNSDTSYSLQLEVISVQAQRILNHRILFIGYAADKTIFGKKLYLQHICFMTHSKMPEEGVYETVNLYDHELWEVAFSLEASNVSPCQVLHIDYPIRKLMAAKEFVNHLPPKIKELNLEQIQKRTESIKKAHQKDGLIDTEI
jgi:hypothetical protein